MIEDYLRAVQAGLSGLPEAEVAEISAELRSHLLEQAERLGEAGAVAAMGPPDELARLYLAERIAERVEQDRSPLPVLKAAVQLAGLGLGAMRSLLVSLAACALGAFLLLHAALKPFMPERIGLWFVEDPFGHFSFAYRRTAGAPGQEVLGWWIVPLWLLIGGMLLAFAWRNSLAAVRRLGRARAEAMAGGRYG